MMMAFMVVISMVIPVVVIPVVVISMVVMNNGKNLCSKFSILIHYLQIDLPL